MSIDLRKFIEEQKSIILEEKRRLDLLEKHNDGKQHCDNKNEYHQQHNNNLQQSSAGLEENKENLNQLLIKSATNNCPSDCSPPNSKNNKIQSAEQVHLKCNEGNLEKSKEAFIDKLSKSENPLTFRSDDNINCAMLRYGEYSPNNPQLRVTAAPYIGLGEYEQRRNYFLQKQKAEYLRHLAKKNESLKDLSKNILSENRGKSNEKLLCASTSNKDSKGVQTDIKNIHSKLVQYELHLQSSPEKELSPRSVDSYIMQNNRNLTNYRVDQRLTSAQNALLKPEMDKPKSILSNRRTGSPRERLMSDLQHSYTPSFMDGFSYHDRSDDLERERAKRENYQHDLRLQIEEKRRMQAMREEQERREQDIENRRLESQLMRMQEEQMIEEQRRNRRDDHMRRHSEDLIRRKQELQSRQSSTFRKHPDESSNICTTLRNTSTDVASKAFSSHYSPPVTRRNPYSYNIPSTSVFAEPSPTTSRYHHSPSRYDPFPHSRFESHSLNRKDSMNRMDSLNTYESSSLQNYNSNSNSSSRNRFSRFDSLSRIDSLNHRMDAFNIRGGDSMSNLSNGQRRHSATQQDLSSGFRRSPKLQRRSSSSRFEDSLPIPVLKAHSPVARELKNSIPFNSGRHSSDAVRKLEDKWQIPAVQKNIVNHNDVSRDGQNRSILTQLGAIRMQLQQEQLRMDETLRKRGITQSKAVDFL